MQVQENSCMKCAGVAGLRARALRLKRGQKAIFDPGGLTGKGAIRARVGRSEARRIEAARRWPNK